jgi:hypothetical protein
MVPLLRRHLSRALILLFLAALLGLAAERGPALVRQLEDLAEAFDACPLTELLGSGCQPRWSSPASTAEIALVSRTHSVDPALLKAFALSLGCDPDSATGLTLDLPPAGLDLLRDWGVPEGTFATLDGRLDAVGRVLPELIETLGTPDAAITALVVGFEPVRSAVELLRANGEEPTFESICARLPRRLRREASAVVPNALSLATAFDLDWPVAGRLRLSSGFGMRVHPIKLVPRAHRGVDIPVATGTEITAPASGTVRRIGEDPINGRYLVIDHGRGVSSLYLHNEQLLIGRGEQVHRGQPIALSGNTGRSTGPHLHYQIELDGTPVDPKLLYQRGETAPFNLPSLPEGTLVALAP